MINDKLYMPNTNNEYANAMEYMYDIQSWMMLYLPGIKNKIEFAKNIAYIDTIDPYDLLGAVDKHIDKINCYYEKYIQNNN